MIPNTLLCRFPSTCDSVPSNMSPPFTAVVSPFSPSSFDLNDDLLHESGILLALCQKTLVDVDLLTASMKSCIFDGYSSLNRQFFWCDGTETPFCIGGSDLCFCGSDLGPFDSDSVHHESMVPESELDLEALPDYVIDCSCMLDYVVPETQF